VLKEEFQDGRSTNHQLRERPNQKQNKAKTEKKKKTKQH
jgi:hypothetical protein